MPAREPLLRAATLPRLLDPAVAHLRDVTLIPARTPGRTLSAHRFLLAAVSPVLRASLAADPAAPVLTLAHADYDALHAVLQFVYGRADVVADLKPVALWNALSLCIAYAVLAPMDAIQTRIVHTVVVANVFFHWRMADKYSMDPVQLKCRKVVKDNFAVVSRHPEFLNVCPASVARVLRIHDLIVQSEDDVFQALERWLAFDVDARAEHALHLLRLVRLPTISDRVLLRVCRSPYFGGHNEFYQLLLEALIRRTEVRIVHAPRIKEITANVAAAPSSSAPVKKLKFTPIGVTDTELLPTAKVKLTEWPPPVRRAEEKGVEEGATMVPRVGKPDEDEEEEGEEEEEEQIRKRKEIERQQQQNIEFNKRQNRTVLFEGLFPLRWYKSVRFRPRSAYSLLFTVVIPKWSSCRRRFISESRSFLNHKWSLWVDPFSADPSRASRDHAMSASQHGSPSRVRHQTQLDRDHDPLYVGNTLESSPSGPSTSRAPPRPTFDENDYISIYLCCESELGGSHTVDARVDFGLFVVSTSEEYGMERKVCVGRTFKSHGQAMGFRRHIRRSRLHSAEAALYNRDKDELVVGAHLVAPDVERPDLGTGSFSQLSRASITADDFRSEGPLSPSSDHLEGSRMTTMETEQSPILTSASRVS